MLGTTYEVFRSVLKSDPTVSAAERARFLALVRQGPDATSTDPRPPDAPHLITRAEAARRLSRSLRFVDQLAADGILQRRKLPGRKRSAGFLASDVDALIAGAA